MRRPLGWLAPLLLMASTAAAQEPQGQPASQPVAPAPAPAAEEPAAPAPAAEPPAAGGPPSAAEHEAKHEAEHEARHEAKKPSDRLTTSLGGRVFFRASTLRSADEGLGDADWTTAESIESARLEATFRWEGWLKAVVEGEFAGRPRLKDAYVRAEEPRTGVQITAGQLKGPGPLLDTTSAWTLPVPERGLLKELLVDRFQSGGRRPGLAVEWTGPGPLAPTVGLGVFQSSDTAGELLATAETSTAGARNLPARIGVTAGPVELGLFGELRSTATMADTVLVGDVGRFWMAGSDAKLGLKLSRLHLRGWADVIVGTHPFDNPPLAETSYTFVSGRILVAPRLGGGKTGRRYVEPFFLFSAMDPNADVRADLMWEVQLGVNVGAWKQARATLAGQIRRTSENTPPFLVSDTQHLEERDALLLQVGASF